MSELDAPIREQLEPLLPLPAGHAPDWDEVLRRATLPPRRRSRHALLVAATVTALLAGGAAALAAGGFSNWLTGQPGSAASPDEQQAFEAANLRTWTAFAPGTQLRKLLSTTAPGAAFTLYGFRSGDDLCLRLEVGGAVTGSATRCAPEHALQSAAEPALVVSVDEPFGGGGPVGSDGYASDTYLATFGIASDGVTRITVEGDDGAHDAAVGGNAFLYVDDHPSHGARVRSVSAESGAGERVALDFQSSPYGMFDLPSPPSGSFHGPETAQRRLTSGTVGWLLRGERPGRDVPGKLAADVANLATNPPPTFATGGRWPQAAEHVVSERLLQPDPNDFIRIVIAGVSPTGGMSDPQAGICFGVIQGTGVGSTCRRLSQAFVRGPLWLTIGGSGMSQYSVLSGIASDDVARIAAYLGNGDVVPVALRDNTFVARIGRASFPLRVVAFDGDGRVVEVQDFASDGMTSPAPARARTTVRVVSRVTGAHGGVATLKAGDAVGGFRCWSIATTGGAEQGGCTRWPPYEDGLKAVALMRAGGDAFLAGEVPTSIPSVRADFPDGTHVTLDTSGGFVLAVVPVSAGVVTLHAFAADGREIAKQGIEVFR